jgi:hypothetical protein
MNDPKLAEAVTASGQEILRKIVGSLPQDVFERIAPNGFPKGELFLIAAGSKGKSLVSGPAGTNPDIDKAS